MTTFLYDKVRISTVRCPSSVSLWTQPNNDPFLPPLTFVPGQKVRFPLTFFILAQNFLVIIYASQIGCLQLWISEKITEKIHVRMSRVILAVWSWVSWVFVASTTSFFNHIVSYQLFLYFIVLAPFWLFVVEWRASHFGLEIIQEFVARKRMNVNFLCHMSIITETVWRLVAGKSFFLTSASSEP